MEFAYAAEKAAEKAVTVSVETGFWHAVVEANLAVQFTLLVLLIMSIGTWTIIFHKFSFIKKLREYDKEFSDVFWKASSLDEIFDDLDGYSKSSMARVFKYGYLELRKIADSSLAGKSDGSAPLLSGIDNLERALRKAIDGEIARVESRLNFLATTGSTGPFIGLFGTVWGIMGSFQKIGATGSASLAVVAPGIAEALIATGIGLAAAIPATIGYNHFVGLLKRQEIELNSFAADFLNIAKRNFFREA